MADFNWTPSGGALSNFYSGSMAPPIKLPNGQYIPAPNVLSVEEIYRGILPAAPPAPRTSLTSRPVTTVPVDAYGNPITRTAASPSGIQRTVGQAGNVAMPPGVVPKSVQQAFASNPALSAGQRSAIAAVPSVPSAPPITLPATIGPPGFVNTNKDWSRLPGGSELAFVGEPAPLPAALGAINSATVPLPRVRPDIPQAPRSSGNQQVAALQQQLASRGFSPGAIDGINGAKTDAAVRAFQQANGLKVDGIVGPKTMAALNGASSAPTPLPRPASLSLPTAPRQSGFEPFGLLSGIMSLPPTVAERTALIEPPIKRVMNPPSPSKPASGTGSRGYTPSGNAWFDSVTGRG